MKKFYYFSKTIFISQINPSINILLYTYIFKIPLFFFIISKYIIEKYISLYFFLYKYLLFKRRLIRVGATNWNWASILSRAFYHEATIPWQKRVPSTIQSQWHCPKSFETSLQPVHVHIHRAIKILILIP